MSRSGPRRGEELTPAAPTPRVEGLSQTLAWKDIPTGSPWIAMGRRFLRHRIAVVALFLLVALYGTGLFAEFVAPYGPERQRTDYLYCPPQVPSYSIKEGWTVPRLRMQRDPVTFRPYFSGLAGEPVHLGFFVRGEAYRLCGVIPWDRHLFGVRSPDAGTTSAPQEFYLLGSDKFGRDIFSRLIFGARISLSIGLVSIALSLLLGLLIGGVSGYVGGGLDIVVQRVIEILNAIPQLPFWLVLAAVLPAGAPPVFVYFAITLALGFIGWAELARVVRGRILALREEEYITAARLIGASPARILVRHLFPGLLSHVLVVLTTSIPTMILGETSLSFLGLGLRAPVVSWGVMLQDTMSIQSVANYPWLLAPAALIVLAVLCFNFLGDGLRDTADPYTY